jgi:hypothetical protein
LKNTISESAPSQWELACIFHEGFASQGKCG